jgi:rhamnosyltransferase
MTPARELSLARGQRNSAGVVVFDPDSQTLLDLVDALSVDATTLFVLINASRDHALAADLAERGARVMCADVNLGVGEALNILALAAILGGHERLALFDQDSRPPPDMIARLGQRMDELAAAGETPGVVGPLIAPPSGAAQAYKSPRMFAQPGKSPIGAAQPVRYVITSGSLIDLGAFRSVGRFRSDFFIDAIDTEWCFRAWRKGRSVWCDTSVQMEHRIGSGVMRGLGGRVYPKQARFRHYAYFRNQAYCLRLAHIPLGWKARTIAHGVMLALSLLRAEGREAATNCWRGVCDGLAGRLGPPEGAKHTVHLAFH